MDESDRWAQKELERLERQQKMLHDQYNTIDEITPRDEYTRIIKANLSKFHLLPSMSLVQIVDRLEFIVEQASSKNIRTHISCAGGAWYTHKDKRGYGCFMCEDLYLIKFLLSLVQYLAKIYPKSSPLDSLL